MTSNNAILLISAPDQKGLVYVITEFIYKNNGNILHAEQHIDPISNIFFMRIEWNLDNFTIPSNIIKTKLEPLTKQWRLSLQLYFADEVVKSAIFVSKKQHCLHDLLLKHQYNELPMNLACIISNHEDGMEIAKFYDIPYYHIPKKPHDKDKPEQKEISILKKHKVELIILARYMQILSPNFINTFPNKIINVHHSFLPAFIGLNPYKQAYERGVKIIGSTSHYTTEILDDGPIIDQQVLPTSHKDNLQNLIIKGKTLESIALSNAVKKHLNHKICVYNSKTVVFD